MRGDRSEPIACRPAHRGGIGVDLGTAAIFPDAGVGRKRKLRRLVAQRLQEMKQVLVSRPWQPSVEEHRHRREDDAAIAVMLLLMNCRVADANRTFVAISR